MGCMKEQSLPDGQHRAACVPVLFNERHVDVEGQQKFDGRPWPHCKRLLSVGHVRVFREKRLSVSTAAASTEVAGKLADTQQRSVASRKREECMLDDAKGRRWIL
jgi:hypothetical protein